jgi:uncharacterized membrane protein YhaH (DUF805 family)
MTEREWFYVEAGAQRGPHTAEELAGIVRRLGGATLVWRAGMAGWVPADAVPELAGAPSPASFEPPSPSRAAPGDEPHTLNPLILWRRSFSWRGRFTRSEFAIARLGFGLLGVLVLGGAMALVMLTGGERNRTGLILVGALLLLWVPVALAVTLGSTIRRLNDLGQSPWLVLLGFLPCLNLAFLVYLLAVKGRDPWVPATTSGVPVAVLVVVLAVLVLAVPMTIGMIAAIAIPSLLRARVSANEAGAIGNVRTVVSAQAAYQSVNGGFYDGRWECLSRPQGCISGYNGPTFLDGEMFERPRYGYVHELHGGARAAGLSPSSTETFAVLAYPVEPGKTGVRAFCGDASGRVCAVSGGAREQLLEAAPGQAVRCAEECRGLQ